MEKELGKICSRGFSFFGITNRLISHELKNILAIISETLGLFNELVELSGSGTELEPGKLQSLSDSIIEEVERANTIIRSMNTFAHSVDEIITEVDISQTVALIVQISQLDSISRNTELQLVRSDIYTVYTSPFFLGNLIYDAIHFALRCAGPDKKIQVSVHPSDSRVRITFSGIATNIIRSFSTEKSALLARAISAEISIDAPAGDLHIVIPQRIRESLIQNLATDK